VSGEELGLASAYPERKSRVVTLLRDLIPDGIQRTEAVINIGLRGNPATDAAVACMIGNRCGGRRVGAMTNCAAMLHAVEFALDCSAKMRKPLLILTCNTYTDPMGLGHDYADVSNRIVAKTGESLVVFRRKHEDRRFAVVNEFARSILLKGDPVWTSPVEQTRLATEARVETEAEAKLESPPESSIYRALRPHFPTPEVARPSAEEPWRALPGFRGEHGVLIPQFKIGRYRADFGILGERTRLVVEVDGFTYHSSREAFENDRRRDREILMQGWLVMRFPASEATYEPAACAQQVIDILRGSS
jgi:restriction endonuclease-like protein